jgi:hypothetical protein
MDRADNDAYSQRASKQILSFKQCKARKSRAIYSASFLASLYTYIVQRPLHVISSLVTCTCCHFVRPSDSVSAVIPIQVVAVVVE